jgi:biopolymer transport protein ExbB
MFSLDLVDKGGPMIWPLMILALMGLVLTFERAIFLHKGKIRAGEFLSGIKNLLSKRRLVEALTVCEETASPVANVVKAALVNFEETAETMRNAVEAAAIIEVPNLERRVNTLTLIAKVAPLLGLLGTAVGVYGAYSTVSVEGPYANVALFSEFIAQALLSTVVGLAIAVVAYLAHHFLSNRVDSLIHDMEWVGHDILQFMASDELKQAQTEKSSPE